MPVGCATAATLAVEKTTGYPVELAVYLTCVELVIEAQSLGRSPP